MAKITTKLLLAASPLPLGLITLPLVHAARYQTGHLASAMAGWMLLLLLAQSATVIMAGSLCRNYRQRGATVAISVLATAMSPALACAMRMMTVMVLLHGLAVFAAWAIFCVGLVCVLRVWSVTPSVAAGLIITTMMIFSPIVLTPIFLMMQKLGIHWPWTVSFAINMSPAMWMIGALATGIHYNWFIWFHAPVMYQHIVLGQNTLMPTLWPWWIPCAGAAGVGAIAAVAPSLQSR